MSRLLPSPPDVSLGDQEPRVVDVDDEHADELFAALSSETARSLLSTLHEEPATTSELAEATDTSLQNVQYHLGNLSDADLVEVADTVYSEKGREMNVYAPTSDPLVLFAGESRHSDGIKTALKRLLGGYGILGLSALAVQRLLAVTVPTGSAGTDGYTVTDSGNGGDGGDVGVESTNGGDAGVMQTEAPEAEATGGPMTTTDGGTGGGDVVEVMFDGAAAERAEAAAEHAVSLLEPGVVFFLGAALVFTLTWAYWHYNLGYFDD
ncbi:Helix-turn-helix domain-containing protein [Halopenitus malekzadehii]|uniref:Helix-turn-helix domain-containing protein n=1 Tax=Halopenitus malekzadehii TaxID=1267564 RepID=A0A1H6IF09_9EURY|nr:winged helix-turn-helix domain-containing protein [Halopenitus malekzadehii]SEH46996.1 Helix-turn-helix domain-containing protein [Halopenitus malekzadehii]